MADKSIFSNDAEIAVLSIVLNNPDTAHELAGLKSFMFSSNIHQSIFIEIESLIEKQIPTDPQLIVASLEASGTLNKVGGKKYIQQICEHAYNKDTIEEYKNLVIKSYKARYLISFSVEHSSTEKVNTDNVDEKINGFKKALEDLQSVRGGIQTVHIGETVKDVYADILTGIEHPGISGVSWGIKDLDLATGGKRSGDLWVIGGRPGMAKTALILNSIISDAKAGISSLLFEREMRNPQIVERLVSIETGIPITNIRLRILNNSQVKQIYESLEYIKTLPIYIDTSYRSSDPYYIESTINKYKNLHDIKVVYLDYIGLLVERDDNQTHEIGKYSRLFKALSNELEICSIIVSQLSRAVELRDNKRPIMSDLRQSGNLEEDADLVIGLYRDEYYNKETNLKKLMEFIILKHRNGAPGTVSLRFEDETNKITGL